MATDQMSALWSALTRFGQPAAIAGASVCTKRGCRPFTEMVFLIVEDVCRSQAGPVHSDIPGNVLPYGLELLASLINPEIAMKTHDIHYQILNRHQMSGTENHRDISVHATPAELDELDRTGYLVRERLFSGEHLQKLRESTDRLFEREVDLEKRKTSERSWGAILRYLEYKDPVFLELVQYEPILSIARAMMGPAVRLRGLSARITWPGEEIQSTPYHQHLRLNTVPRPAWFSEPHAMDALIYLDDLNEKTGPICVVPESHKWVGREPPYPEYDPIKNEVELRVPAGTAVLMHANVWHRASPTIGSRRRMLILSYTPCWLRRSPHGTPPETRLSSAILEDATEELRELLGVSGHS